MSRTRRHEVEVEAEVELPPLEEKKGQNRNPPILGRVVCKEVGRVVCKEVGRVVCKEVVRSR